MMKKILVCVQAVVFQCSNLFEIGVLFSEYGVLKSSIARTTDGKPRGFGFIEVICLDDFLLR